MCFEPIKITIEALDVLCGFPVKKKLDNNDLKTSINENWINQFSKLFNLIYVV